MGELQPGHFVLLAVLLFALGAAGAVLRRSAFTLLVSITVMLNASSLLFLAYGKHYGDAEGQALALLVMLIAGAQVAVGLAIVVGVFRARQTVDLDEFDALRDDA